MSIFLKSIIHDSFKRIKIPRRLPALVIFLSNAVSPPPAFRLFMFVCLFRYNGCNFYLIELKYGGLEGNLLYIFWFRCDKFISHI